MSYQHRIECEQLRHKLKAALQRAEAAEASLERESDIHIDTAASMREWRLRAEAAEKERDRRIADYKRLIDQHMPRTIDGCDEGWSRVIEAHELQTKLEAAEAKLETENKWRDLALQFDGYRMQAISLLKMIVNDAPAEQHSSVRNFLKCGPLSGEEVMNERLLAIANSRPAPALSLADMVSDEDLKRVFEFSKFVIKCYRNNGEYSPLSSQEPDEIAAILRNIEEAK